MAKKRDLLRFAAVEIHSGEVLEVGMTQDGADSFCASYNQSMFRIGKEAQRVAIAWTLNGDARSKVNHGTSLN
jgi:hypothetical protein